MDERTRQNLIDAGCPEDLIQNFDSDMDVRRRLDLLLKYRKNLLSGIHTEQAKLDCLDYLIFHYRNGGK
jgi:hypothetical protein